MDRRTLTDSVLCCSQPMAGNHDQLSTAYTFEWIYWSMGTQSGSSGFSSLPTVGYTRRPEVHLRTTSEVRRMRLFAHMVFRASFLPVLMANVWVVSRAQFSHKRISTSRRWYKNEQIIYDEIHERLPLPIASQPENLLSNGKSGSQLGSNGGVVRSQAPQSTGWAAGVSRRLPRIGVARLARLSMCYVGTFLEPRMVGR